jgi:cytochrome P450
MTAAQRQESPQQRAPGPHYLNPLKHFNETKYRGLAYPEELFARYGDMVEIKTYPHSWFLIKNPEAFRHIFVGNAKNYTKGTLFERLKLIGGNGLFFSDGDIWMQNRRIIGPYFKRGNMKYYVDAVVASGRQGVEWVDSRFGDGEFDATALTSRIALYVVGRAFFGMQFSEERLDKLLQAVKDSARFGQSLLQSVVITPWLPTRINRQGKQALKVMYGTIDELIGEGLQREKGEDLLSLLLDSVRSGQMTRKHLSDEMWTIVNAGHETTATTMALMLYHVGKNPEWQNELQAEIDAVLGDRDPEFSDLLKLQKLDWTTKETLRLYPPAPATARQATEDDVIEGYHVPAGSIVQTQFYFAQRDPKYWDDPETFNPRRFSEEEEAARPEYAYLPFGGGGRRCLGEHFAYMEALIVVGMLLREYKVSVRQDFEVEPYQAVALRLRNGARISMQRR